MPEAAADTTSLANTEADAFRLRRFVEKLLTTDEIETVDEPVALADLTAHLDGNPRAVLFRKVGPEEAEIIGNLMASRARLAIAFDVAEDALLREVLKRLDGPQSTVAVERAAAPVQQIVWTDDEADFNL